MGRAEAHPADCVIVYFAADGGRKHQRRYGYPPDKQEKAVQTVLEQVEVLGKDWAA